MILLDCDCLCLHVQVQARTQAVQNGGWGSLSPISTVLTLDGVPGPPLNIVKRYRNASCLQFQWSPPQPANGVITQYTVSIIRLT